MRSTRTCINILLALVCFQLGGGLTAVAAESPAANPSTTNAPSKAPAPKTKGRKPKLPTHLRVHVEAKRELPERSLPAEVGRSTTPLRYNVERLPILNEVHIINASLVNQPGGFQVRIKFNSMGTKLLESYSAAAAGRHLLILTDIDGEARWLAAPLLRQRIGDGTLAFTPDATREEMERLVQGINKAIEKERKQWLQ